MSNRTSAANSAIAEAWAREQQLVREGEGTRDWTPEQQRDIVERGKAYDENGRAYEGQHMKSAEKYPEYQSDPDNIQFLTRSEHFEAHDGNWQNPTNWHYDPKNGQKQDFGDGPPVPCRADRLSQPVYSAEAQEEEGTSYDDVAPAEGQESGRFDYTGQTETAAAGETGYDDTGITLDSGAAGAANDHDNGME